MENKTKREDVDTTSSEHKGFYGWYESLLRRYRSLTHASITFSLYIVASFIWAIALCPSVMLFFKTQEFTRDQSLFVQSFGIALSVAAGFFLFGFLSILVIPFFNIFVRPFIKPARGPYYSVRFIPWVFHNALTYLVRYTFLEYITPTPFNNFFFKLMGMKVGYGTQINTANISDPCLITFKDKVTVGGSATLCAHYAAGGYLILAPVIIGKGATIGLKATIMGDTIIGDGARIMPNSFVLPKSRVPAGETWGGVPAVKLEGY